MRERDGALQLRKLRGADRLAPVLGTAAAAHTLLREPAAVSQPLAALGAKVERGGDPHKVQQLPCVAEFDDVRLAFLPELHKRAP